MEPINILDARNSLSRLIAIASKGEEVVIAKRGVPTARLVAIDDSPDLSAGRAAVWLTTHAVPSPSRRTAGELDAQISAEREGWE